MIPVWGFSQNIEPTERDSLSTEINVRSRISRAELVRVAPLCNGKIRRVRVKGKLFKKNRQSCYAESVLMCTYEENEYPKKECEIDTSRLRNHKEVENADLDSILHLLYESEQVEYIAVCYMPRHGILFYEENDVVIGFVELCFECDRAEVSSHVLDVGLLPASIFDRLEELFEKYGVK